MLTVGTQKVNSQKMANVEPENDEKSSDGPTMYYLPTGIAVCP